MAVADAERRTFPLVPRRRPTGLPVGDLPSRRRGHGVDVTGTRPYERGDPVSVIDWFASARLSTARNGDEFVVRARAADEAPRVVIVLDRRPAMSLYPQPLPWLDKREAILHAATAVASSASAARADVAALDLGDGEAWWLPPGRRDRVQLVAERAAVAPFCAPDDALERAFAYLLGRTTDVPADTIVFAVSDFLPAPATEIWVDALAHGWDVVPVVVQDATWERSFPDVAGVALPVADPRTGRVRTVRIGAGEVRRMRTANERRYETLLTELSSLGMQPVEIASSDPWAVDEVFIVWAEHRRRRSRWR